MQANPAVEQNKYSKLVHEINPRKNHGEKDLSKSQVLSLVWKTEGREDESGGSECYELPCMKEASSDACKVCLHEFFHRQGEAYRRVSCDFQLNSTSSKIHNFATGKKTEPQCFSVELSLVVS